MNAFLFPGQGSQHVGMGSDLFDSSPAFQQLVLRASNQTQTDLQHLCLHGPDRELMRTEFLQPLLVCVSLGYLRLLTQNGVQPDIVLGHSLGEITALAAAGIVTPETAVDIAVKRGELMAAAAAQKTDGMLAVLATDRETVLSSIASFLDDGHIAVANDNAPNQFVLSGELAALRQAGQLIKQSGLGQGRALPVTGAWHSPRMAPARQAFDAWLSSMDFQPPRVPMIFNATAATETDPTQIRSLVARNLVEPVRWQACMSQLKTMTPLALFEIGPGRVLSGLARANGFGHDTRVCAVNNLRGVALAAQHL